jgi:predicted Rossmann fold flavoprotein
MGADRTERVADVAIVGAGAAGLATAIFVARRRPGRRVVVLDGATTLCAKLLLCGGGRCNVTNAAVTPADYRGGNRNVIRRVLSEFGVEQTRAFFLDIGVELVEEEQGKLFPRSGGARRVADALLGVANSCGVRIARGRRVTAIDREGDAFRIRTERERVRAARVVLATGGRSWPMTGSDGSGYGLAQALGHSLVPTTPALVPLVLEGDFHRGLSGISHEAEITLSVRGRRAGRWRGQMLWTHFGVSGPVVLDASGPWHRAMAAGLTRSVRSTDASSGDVGMSVSLLPGDDFAAVEGRIVAASSDRPGANVQTLLRTWLPERLAAAILERLGINARVRMAHLTREDRRRLVHALVASPMPVIDSRGYDHAEVTAGGVPLDEVDPRTLESRKCPGLFFAGEILDVDGRVGGFNLQWAWSSAWVAASGL